MGYQYELLRDLANHLDIKLEVVVSNNLEETFNCLMMGDCDLIAYNLTVTTERKKQFSFTVPHSQRASGIKPVSSKNSRLAAVRTSSPRSI